MPRLRDRGRDRFIDGGDGVMSFTDNYTLGGSTITVPEAVASPGYGPPINGSFGIPAAGSQTQLPAELSGKSICFANIPGDCTPRNTYTPNFSSVFGQFPNSTISGGGSGPTPAGDITTSPTSGGGTATNPGTSSQACTWSVFGFCLTQIFIVILGIIFIAAGLWMFAGRSEVAQAISAARGPLE